MSLVCCRFAAVPAVAVSLLLFRCRCFLFHHVFVGVCCHADVANFRFFGFDNYQSGLIRVDDRSMWKVINVVSLLQSASTGSGSIRVVD